LKAEIGSDCLDFAFLGGQRPATFAGMIRLLLSALAFALFAAPSFAQEDDLPPLPSRAEVLAEIEALASGPDATISSITAVLNIWEFEPSLAVPSRRLTLRIAELYSSALTDDPDEVRLVTGPINRLVAAGEYEAAWDIFSRMEAVRDARALPEYQSDYQNEVNVMEFAARELGRGDIANEYAREHLAVLEQMGTRSSYLDALIFTANDAFYDGDFVRMEGFHRRALSLILAEPDLSANGDQWDLLNIIELQILAGQPELLGLLFDVRASMELGADDNLSFYADLARSAASAGNDGLTRRFLNEAMQHVEDVGYWDSREFLNAGLLFAQLGECDTAIAMANLTRLWQQEYDASAMLWDIEQKQRDLQKQSFAEDNRIILVHAHYSPHQRASGLRARIAIACQSFGIAADSLLADSYRYDPMGLRVTVHGIEEGLEAEPVQQLLRATLGQKLAVDRLLAAADARFESARLREELAYMAYLLREGGRDESADRVLHDLWPLMNSEELDPRERLEALAWLTLALPE